MNLKNYHSALWTKNSMIQKNFNKLKAVNPQTNENKELKPKVLDNVGDLFNDLYYIYKDKYNEEKDGLNTKNKKLLYYKKLRLHDYQYDSEEEKQQASKASDKKDEESKLDKKNKNFLRRLKIKKKMLINC